jgi:hypothetical protein
LTVVSSASKPNSVHIAFRLPNSNTELLSKAAVILLDTSIWNRLADAKTCAAAETRDLAIALRSRQHAVFPLCDSTIWEVRKQGASLHRTVELMEVLSSNITFRPIEQLYDAEVERFVQYLLTGEFSLLSVSERFGPLLSCLGRGFQLGPLHKAGDASSRLTAAELSQRLDTLTLSSLVGYLKRPEVVLPQLVNQRREVALRRRALARGSVELARRIETEYVARAHLLPRLTSTAKRLSPEQRLLVSQKLRQLPRSRRFRSAIEHVLRFTPAMAASVEMETLGGLDVQRVGGENDFNDLALTVYGLSYAHSFAAVDGWIASLLSLARDKQFPVFVRFAGSLEALKKALEDLQTGRQEDQGVRGVKR